MPGYSVFYSAQGVDVTTALSTYYSAIAALFPAPLSWSIPPSGDTINDATGELVGAWTGVGAGIIAASGSGSYAASVGALAVPQRLAGAVFPGLSPPDPAQPGLRPAVRVHQRQRTAGFLDE